MARNSIVMAVVLAICAVALCACRVSVYGAPPEKEPASKPRAVNAITLEQFRGEMRVKPGANGHGLAISEVVDLKEGTLVADWRVVRRVYAISLGQEAPFKDMTETLGGAEGVLGTSCPGPFPATLDGPKFEFDTWEFKLPAAKGVTYLVTALGTMTFSNGKVAICHFDPIIITDGKAIAPELFIPPEWFERPRAKATKKAPGYSEGTLRDARGQER